MAFSAHTILDGSKIGSSNLRLMAVIALRTRTFETSCSVIRKLHCVWMVSLVIIFTNLEGHKIH